ncbi:MAG: RNA polymerase sigma factor [Chloroflexi bacterium]|nr:RNA polymerase sigma factor [Chloroflexota bacterium]
MTDSEFEILVLTYQDAIYRFGLRLTGCPSEAEDVAQDAFVRAFQWLRRNPPDGDFQMKPWLYRVALNVARSRARRRPPPTAGLAAAAAVVDEHLRGPVEHAELQESRFRLEKCLSQLPIRYRESVVLRHIEELSYLEIASVLRRPVGTVKSDVHRGLALLRSTLESLERGEVDEH